MQFYKLNKICEWKIKPADFQILSAQHFQSFCQKISLKTGFRLDHDSWYVNNLEWSFFPTEIEALRELEHFGHIKNIIFTHSPFLIF